MKLIKQIQSHIHSIYGIDVGEEAADYLIGENELISLLPAQQRTVIPRELFLVNPRPQEDTLEIALFFDENLKKNLAANDPLTRLNDENISDFCTVIEGVSHFVYYLHKAALEHDITELEMELQAEIDKFVLLSFFAEALPHEKYQLLDLLFENYFLVADLLPEQAERYQTATGLARKYCYELLKRFKSADPTALLKEIRSFYPLRQDQKVRHILA